MKIKRREFLGGAAAFAAMAGGCARSMTGCGRKHWYKGNLHTHTFWSDGKAFPEEAVMWYKSRGYNFLGLSDHNLFQDDPDRWVGIIGDDEKDVKPEWAKSRPHRYCYNARRRYFDAYAQAFPGAVTRTNADGRLEARLSTFAELSARFNSPGEFLLVPDVEATRSVEYSDGRYHQLHMNYVNVPELLPSIAAPGFVRRVKDKPLSEFLAEHERETSALAKKHARKPLFILNHPIWTWYDVGPEVLVDAPDVRFFEVCNGGSPFEAADALPADGLDTDRFWDVVNAFRARRGQPLVYGIGTDDTHNYRGEKANMCIPGNAWSLVRAESLDADSLVEAMDRGDFVTCEGLEPEDVDFDAGAGRLEVAVGVSDAPRTIRFIVSKRDFGEKPVGKVTVRPAKHKDVMRFQREISIYDEKVGCVAKTVEVPAGQPMRTGYTLADDDLYVRARIEERGTTVSTAHLHPKGLRCAWTQPYRL
jgi:hypothetical protein